ncbi:hypothetical protein [Fodinicola feengrottensis]|uniref:hypothetical protein n=1 Tax=Fodinicola feengrottensis TaxID=435914 RepID=UPI0013D85F43|nr:hypothetical protein [Fodinicola feengrottensis]
MTAVNVSVGVPPPSSDAVSVRTSTMTVQASVPEADVSHISAGQSASVTFPALGSGSTPVDRGVPAGRGEHQQRYVVGGHLPDLA